MSNKSRFPITAKVSEVMSVSQKIAGSYTGTLSSTTIYLKASEKTMNLDVDAAIFS
jgi:hypothetical protein